MRAPSSAARRAIAHARLRLLATPNTIPVFPSRSISSFQFPVSSFQFPVTSNQKSETGNSKLKTQKLLSLVGRDLQRHILAGAPYQNLDLFTRSHLAQCVGVIVDVLDRRLAKLDDNIVGLQAGFLGGRAGAHAVQLHPIALIGIVRK